MYHDLLDLHVQWNKHIPEILKNAGLLNVRGQSQKTMLSQSHLEFVTLQIFFVNLGDNRV